MVAPVLRGSTFPRDMLRIFLRGKCVKSVSPPFLIHLLRSGYPPGPSSFEDALRDGRLDAGPRRVQSNHRYRIRLWVECETSTTKAEWSRQSFTESATFKYANSSDQALIILKYPSRQALKLWESVYSTQKKKKKRQASNDKIQTDTECQFPSGKGSRRSSE